MGPLRLFLIIVLTALVFELVYFDIISRIFGRPLKTNHKFFLGKNISLISIPILGLIALFVAGQYTYVQLFFIGAIIGTVLEYALGKLFHHIDGKRLWTYNFASIKGYTSWLSIPYWGAAALLFTYISKLVGF